MKKVLITGGEGFLASMVQRYNKEKFDFEPVYFGEVDYTNMDAVRDFFSNKDFDICFHTAANANTQACENDLEGTNAVNRDAAIEISKICREKGKRMMFISTEQLFNGYDEPGPWTEEDTPKSVTNYGIQKSEVDAWMHENMDNYVTLRLSWQFGMAMPGIKPSPGIVLNVLRALHSKTPTKFTVNEKRCMTYAMHLAEEFEKVTELESGIYHFASANDKSTYESAKFVAERWGATQTEIDELILPDNERYAERFRDYRLDASKARAAGINLATFDEDVDRCLSDFGW